MFSRSSRQRQSITSNKFILLLTVLCLATEAAEAQLLQNILKRGAKEAVQNSIDGEESLQGLLTDDDVEAMLGAVDTQSIIDLARQVESLEASGITPFVSTYRPVRGDQPGPLISYLMEVKVSCRTSLRASAAVLEKQPNGTWQIDNTVIFSEVHQDGSREAQTLSLFGSFLDELGGQAEIDTEVNELRVNVRRVGSTSLVTGISPSIPPLPRPGRIYTLASLWLRQVEMMNTGVMQEVHSFIDNEIEGFVDVQRTDIEKADADIPGLDTWWVLESPIAPDSEQPTTLALISASGVILAWKYLDEHDLPMLALKYFEQKEVIACENED